MRSRHLWLLAIPYLSFVGLIGCGKAPEIPKVVPVKGVVTLDGQPLAGASITLITSDPKMNNGVATSDDKGQFEVTTYFDSTHLLKGVTAGEYKVTVSKMSDSGPPDPALDSPKKEDRAKMEADRLKKMTEFNQKKDANKGLPAKYGVAATSGLTAVVTSGMEPLKLELKN